MRHRSLTNSHPWEDPAIQEDYRRANEYDELLRFWPTEGAEACVLFGGSAPGMWLSKRWTPRNAIHHVAKGANGASRADVFPNLIALSRTLHDWVEAYRADGMALCMRSKIEKGEWDDAVMKSVFGLERPGASIAEFIGRKRPFVWPWVEPHWQFCIEWERKRGAA